MNLLNIALKDLRRIARSVFALVMMFGAPLLIAGLLYFAFGGLAGGGYNLSAARVVVANLDAGNASAGSPAAGSMLVEFLQDEELSEVIALSTAPDAAAARQAVDERRADVALIIPANFSEAALGPGQQAVVELYQDPTLTIAPGIVKDLAAHFMDGFSGAKIAGAVTETQLRQAGLDSAPGVAQAAALQYAAYIQSSSHASPLRPRTPDGASQADAGAAMIGPIMASMMIFFAFYMGATGAETIIREQEEGTLARLFTTPVSRFHILGGKFLSVLLTLFIQITVLLGVSALIFGIRWGQLLPAALVTFGLIVAAAGFGVFLMSFVKTTRQAGPVLGGVLTLTGMLGGLFTNGVPNLPALMERSALILPQGWALKAWKMSLAGAGFNEVLVPVLVMTGMGAALFAIGLALFRKRFA